MRGNTLDFYFTNSLGDYPWYEGDIEWFRDTLAQLLPKKYKNYQKAYKEAVLTAIEKEKKSHE